MAFPNLTFSYRAFIPQSVGRRMTDIFRNHRNFNRQDMVNYDDFLGFLREMDTLGTKITSGGNWIAEPPPVSTLMHTFAMTNDGEFNAGKGTRRHTTGKVSIEGSIDLSAIGHIYSSFPSIRVPPTVEAFQCMAGIVPQMSALNVGYPGVRLTTNKYVGVFRLPKMLLSQVSGSATVVNKSEGTYIARQGTPIQDLYDTTILTATAAGSYPFIKFAAPDIDMRLVVKLRRQGNAVTISFEGLHDRFPAYELVVNGVRRKLWNPVTNGELGPDLINLNSRNVRTSFTMYERIPVGYKPLPKRSPFDVYNSLKLFK